MEVGYFLRLPGCATVCDSGSTFHELPNIRLWSVRMNSVDSTSACVRLHAQSAPSTMFWCSQLPDIITVLAIDECLPQRAQFLLMFFKQAWLQPTPAQEV